MNAPLYGMPEPTIADAWAYTARAVNRELRREAYVGPRIKELVGALTGPVRRPHRVEPGPWCPMGTRAHDVIADMAYWCEERRDMSVHDQLCVLLVCDAGTHAEMCEQYAVAKATAEAKGVE